MTKELTAKERIRFSVCKKRIADGLQTCFDTGLALTEIRNAKLYREDFDTFAEFCQQTYKLGKTHAYRLIESAEIKQDISERSPAAAKLITNEHQARALADLPAGEQVKVLKELARDGGVITAEAIRAKMGSTFNATAGTIDRNVSPIGDKNKILEAKKELVLDDIGVQIPGDALPFWHRRQEIQDMLNQVSRLKCAVEKAKTEGDPMFGKVSNTLITDLTSAYTHLLEAKPYAVCTSCSGFVTAQPKGCAFCGNKGLISKWQWDTQAKKEVKEIRLKSVALKQ